VRLLCAALDEIMDVFVSVDVVQHVEVIARKINGVESLEKCRIRKVGLHPAMDLHVRVNGNLSVREGHDIAHAVISQLMASQHRISDVIIHIEPASEFEK
jgi:divalent metal cation (Fe/Co/Zn/Cd) transporter